MPRQTIRQQLINGKLLHELDLTETEEWERRKALFSRYSTEEQARFAQYRLTNAQVIEEFFRQADIAWQKGHTSYSANCIVEFIRHHTNISEDPTTSAFKIDSTFVPMLGRYYIVKNPERNGFFRFKMGKRVR